MTLESIYNLQSCNMYPSEHAAIVRIDNMWYMVALLAIENAYYYNVLLINGSNEIHTTLQIDHPVTMITESDIDTYGIVL